MVVVAMVAGSGAGAARADFACEITEVCFDCSGFDALDAGRRREGPLETVEAFYRAYARRDAERLRELTNEAFVSLSQDAAFTEAFPKGMTLSAELRMLESMRDTLAAETDGAVVLSIQHDGLTLEGEPSFESAQVIALRPVLRIVAGTHIEEAVSLRHRFVLVREPGDASHAVRWSILAWIEELGEPDALHAARTPERAPEPVPAAPALDEDLPRTLAFTRAAAEPGPVLAFGVALPRAAEVAVSLIDVQGRVSERSHSSELAAGRHVVRLTGANALPGIYWARLQTGAETRTLRVTVVR